MCPPQRLKLSVTQTSLATLIGHAREELLRARDAREARRLKQAMPNAETTDQAALHRSRGRGSKIGRTDDSSAACGGHPSATDVTTAKAIARDVEKSVNRLRTEQTPGKTNSNHDQVKDRRGKRVEDAKGEAEMEDHALEKDGELQILHTYSIPLGPLPFSANQTNCGSGNGSVKIQYDLVKADSMGVAPIARMAGPAESVQIEYLYEISHVGVA